MATQKEELNTRHANDHVYCTLHRNGSGQDSGLIDYSISLGRIDKLDATDRRELLKMAQWMLDDLREYLADDDAINAEEQDQGKPELAPGESPHPNA